MLFAMNQDPSVLYQCTIAFLSEDHCSSTFYSTSTKKTDDKKKEKGYLPTVLETGTQWTQGALYKR